MKRRPTGAEERLRCDPQVPQRKLIATFERPWQALFEQ
jgi:hypothetical protein